MTVDKAGNSYFTGETLAGSFTYKINSQGVVIWNNPNPIYLPTGFIYSDLSLNVYYSVEVKRNTTGDTLLNYLNTYDDANGVMLSSQLIPILLPESRILCNAKMTIDNNINLIIGVEQAYDVQPINIYKYTFQNLTAISDSKNNIENCSLTIYPNPTTSVFTINYSSNSAQGFLFRIINSKGQIIYSESITQYKGEYTQIIDMKNQAKGVYFIEIIAERIKTVRKIVLD